MFKQMRNKMLLTNMVLLSLVIFFSFAVLYGVSYKNAQSEIVVRYSEAFQKTYFGLSSYTEESGFHSVSERAYPEFRDTGKLSMDRTYGQIRPYFTLTINEKGKLIEVAGELFASDEFYFRIFDETWDQGKKSGSYSPKIITFEGRKWCYWYSNFSFFTAKGEPDLRVTQIMFLDVTQYAKQLNQLLLTLVLTGFVALVAIFFISLSSANRAIKPIEESWHKQKQFVADASHELKTPIAVISANVDAIEASAEETVSSQKEWFFYIKNELSRMNKLVSDMLFLTRAEDETVALASLDMTLLCDSIIASTEAVLYEKNLSLTTEIEKDVHARGDRENIEQAIRILLDNAAKYTDVNGSIAFSLKKEKDRAVLSVTNTGEGIEQEDLPKIFDRFYRLDTSRTEESGGYGLGLAIAKAKVERSEGHISAQSENNLTTFTISLKQVLP